MYYKVPINYIIPYYTNILYCIIVYANYITHTYKVPVPGYERSKTKSSAEDFKLRKKSNKG